jgi:hypothetical protein
MDGLMIYMEIFPTVVCFIEKISTSKKTLCTGLGCLKGREVAGDFFQPSSAALAFNSVTPCPLATPTSELSRGVSIVVRTGL